MPALIPRTQRRVRISAGNHPTVRKRRRAHEAFIRKNFVRGGMIDRQQPYLVQINSLFHRLEESEAQHPVARLHAARRHFQVFVRVWNVTLSRRDPMAQDRKSTRLNSSHPSISYAVFCLKKKKQKN